MVKKSLLLSLILYIGMTLSAAENPVVEMQLLSAISYTPNTSQWNETMAPALSLSISSGRSGNVRGEVVLKTPNPMLFSTASTSDIYEEILHKAYFKARFPSVRLTAGKTRLSWGDGMLFNAGDVLYGSNDTSVTLTQSELRSETGLLVSLNYPLGFFSFAEAVVLPSPDMQIEHMGGGARLYTTVQETKVEAGYLTSYESERLHKPYISLQGNIGPDWYLSSSLAIPQSGDIGEETLDSWVITGGLFHIQYLENDKNVSLRLEFLTRPAGNWKLESQSDADCPLLLYPEVVYTPSSSLSWSLRTIISPLDLSFNATLGVNWAVLEGFSLLGFLSAPVGEKDDLFSWKGKVPSPYGPKDGSISLSLGASWIF
ncbi:hypothetical protein [Sphaerochaeta sp. S2]|uniref:hypothetical protein n=1 Tax=Sphaerochaeta sp. S2 TaxID=2798868 RepID=UPI0018EA2359|nr:hypothetical protein [Sphaerochaeta sp. S2]MBJ2356800.1 hypothetical protein [Sphaerochaeta sp. S2]